MKNYLIHHKIYSRISTTLLLVLGLLLSSCVEEVTDIDLPETQPKLAVFCFITPGQTEIEAGIRKTLPVLNSKKGTAPFYINDATVLLSDGQDTIQLVYNNATTRYHGTGMVIVPGKKYYLKVTTPDGLKATSSCTVPSQINTSLTAVADSMSIDATEKAYIIRAKFTDLPGAGNYYKLDAEQVLVAHNDTVYDALEMETSLFTDQKRDGGQYNDMSYDIRDFNYLVQSEQMPFLNAYLLTCDVHYAKYHETLRLALLNAGSNLFTEPVVMYTNIESGVGAFGAYRSYKIKVPVR